MTDSPALRKLERQVRRRLDVRMAGRRVWESLPAIIQIVSAVAAAYSIAHYGLGHAVPILAVTVTINSLGFTRDARPRRVVETVIGILLGVALSDGLSLMLGKGLWQLVVVLLVVFVIGRALRSNPAFGSFRLRVTVRRGRSGVPKTVRSVAPWMPRSAALWPCSPRRSSRGTRSAPQLGTVASCSRRLIRACSRSSTASATPTPVLASSR